MTNNAVCCINVECPVYTWGEPDKLDTLIVYGDDQTNLHLKLQELSFLSASLFEIILTVSRVGHPTVRSQSETPLKQSERSGPLHGMDSLMECMFSSPRISHNGLWGYEE